jgi:hypothetical protein
VHWHQLTTSDSLFIRVHSNKSLLQELFSRKPQHEQFWYCAIFMPIKRSRDNTFSTSTLKTPRYRKSFTVLRPAQEFFTYMETSPLPVKGCELRPMLSIQGLCAGRDLYRATPTVARDLGFSGHIRRTAPINRLLRHAWGCRGPILTRILTGCAAIRKWLRFQRVISLKIHVQGLEIREINGLIRTPGYIAEVRLGA